MKKSVHVLTVLVYVLSLLLANAGTALAEDTKSATKIRHKPLKYFVPGHRITVNAEVTDQTGISVVRCYFRATEQADYVFVSLNPATDGTYEGILPAPSKETQTVTYLFLAVNGKNQVVKTQTFAVNKEDKEKVPAWQQSGSEGNIQVSTELAQAPENVAGFTDSIAMDVVESSARFGFVAGGIYLLTQDDDSEDSKDSAGKKDSAATGTSETAEITETASLNDRLSGSAASATSGGTITASAGGLSTAAIIGIGAGVAAGIAGIAAVAGSSGGSDDDNGSANDGSPPKTVTGVWEFHYKCDDQETDAATFDISINQTSGGAFNGNGNGIDYDGTGMQVNITGTYDSSTYYLNGEIRTTFSEGDCVRIDTFSTTLSSNDTGYISAQQIQMCGCDAEIRLIKR